MSPPPREHPYSSLLALPPPPPLGRPPNPGVNPTSPSRPGPLQGAISLFASILTAKAALLRSEMNHSVIISGVPSGLPPLMGVGDGGRGMAGGAGHPWGVCERRAAARGSIAPPGGPAADDLWSPSGAGVGGLGDCRSAPGAPPRHWRLLREAEAWAWWMIRTGFLGRGR